MIITRRHLLLASAAAAGSAAMFGSRAFAATPPLAKKDTYKVGFAQSESNNPWRIAETKSMQDEAKRLGYQLVYTDAASSSAKQASDVQSMIAQGVDAIFLPPREDKPLVPVILQAKEAGIPVFLIDRDVDHTMAKPGEDYVTFIGSDFIEESTRVANWMFKNAGDKRIIIELEGTTGAPRRRTARRVSTPLSPRMRSTRSSRRRMATLPVTRDARSLKLSSRRILTQTSSTPTMTKWRWAQSQRSRPRARPRARMS